MIFRNLPVKGILHLRFGNDKDTSYVRCRLKKFITTMKKYFILSMILGIAIGCGARSTMEVRANENLSVYLDAGRKDKKKDKKKEKQEGDEKSGEKKSCAPGGGAGHGCCHGKKAS